MRTIGWVALLLTAASCTPQLPSGEWGTLRYFGNLLGEPPMRLLPPLTDRQGNVHVLYGAPDRADTQVFVGRRSGGWTGGCSAHRGVGGVHGFVGRSDERTWYWSGTALVEVDGRTGACSQILRDDPVSGTELLFLGVAPFIDETPSRRFAYALVQGATGAPQFLMVDLDSALPFNSTPLEAEDRGSVEVIGTGAWTALRITVFVVRRDGETVVLFVDRFGDIQRQLVVDLPNDVGAYGIQGMMQFSDGGIGAGLIGGDRVLVVSVNEARVRDVGFEAQGLLRFSGRLFVTGEDGDGLAIAEVGADGTLGATQPFRSARIATNGLDGEIAVNDERGDPARPRSWTDPVSAIGSRPLVSPYPIDSYTLWSAGWLVAGPNFDSGVEPVTAVAFAPVGVELP
ncbi:MAG: hypothetical protein KTR31_06290 [Myxococcales bacterium]|nr:hypothetical protein [Myxococcales bacterium]